jgi:pterin-4a-carbinolamine dehydratase
VNAADGAAMKHSDPISVEHWHRHGNTLVRELEFRDSDEAVAFANRVAEEAVDYSRRPELTVTLNRVRVAVANLHHLPPTRAEVRLARKVDAVLAEHQQGP